jgi:hypothetical protein
MSPFAIKLAKGLDGWKNSSMMKYKLSVTIILYPKINLLGY